MAAVVLLLGAGVVVGFAVWSGPSPVATLDGTSVPTGRNPEALDVGSGFVWSANQDDGTVSKIDPRRGTSQTIEVGGHPFGLAADTGATWVATWANEIARIDAATGAIKTFPVGPQASSIAVGGGYVWISDTVTNTVSRINASTLLAEGAPIPVGKAPSSLVSDNGRLWVSNTGDRSIVAIDERSGEVVAGPIRLSSDVLGVQPAGGILYVATGNVNLPADQQPFEFTPVDETSLVVGRPFALTGASFVKSDGTALWAAYPFANEVRKIDPRTGGQVGPPLTGVGKGLGDVVVLDADLWVVDAIHSTALRAPLGT